MKPIKKAPADSAKSIVGAHSNKQVKDNTFLQSSQIAKECRQESYIQRPTRHQKILDALAGREMTAREIAESLGYRDLNAVKPRLTELLQAGKVEVIGKRLDLVTNRNVSVWRAKGGKNHDGIL